MPSAKPSGTPVISQAEFAAGAKSSEQLPAPVRIEIAFAGRSNVGKSSLMNALLGRKNLVRTSSTPGCTRQISFFDVKTKAGETFSFVDLPGYGYAQRSKAERASWAQLIDAYLLERPTLALVLVLFDVRRGLAQDELALVEMLSEPGDVKRPPVACLLVATKLDKVKSSVRKLTLDRVAKQTGHQVIGVSTQLPETHAALWRALRQSLGLSGAATSPA